MITLDVLQGTTEWAQARLGIPTASCFDQIITPKTMKPSASAEKYAARLLAEQILGEPLDDATSGFMQRGTLQEQKAVTYYELQQDVETTPVGFILRNDRKVGATPDRLVGSDGLLEVKCPAAHTHVLYLLDDEGIGYKAQVQGQLWIAEREYVDTISYNPFMPTAIVRQRRDEKFIAALAQAVADFLGLMEQMRARLIAKGCVFPTTTKEARVA